MRAIMKYYKIWLPVLSIIVFFGLAEIICRSFSLAEKFDADFKFNIRNVDNDLEELKYMTEDPYLMWFPAPDYSDGTIKINSRGFRDRERTVKKDKNVFRILCLGDSSTFGLYVPLVKTYHALLEEKLNSEFGRSKTKFEVINAGVPGYTSYQGLHLYKKKGRLYEPDIVIFYFGVNDTKKEFYLDDKQIVPDVPSSFKVAAENNFLMKLDSYRILRKIIVKLVLIYRNAEGETVQRVSPEDFKANILELNRLCKNNGSSLLLIMYPFNIKKVNELRKERAIVLLREMESISKKNNIPLIKIPEMTQGAPSDIRKYFWDEVHPNETGHRIIMGKIYNCLINNKLLPENRKQ